MEEEKKAIKQPWRLIGAKSTSLSESLLKGWLLINAAEEEEEEKEDRRQYGCRPL